MQRENILFCALKHLDHYPLEHLSVTKISQELQISRSTFYNYFSNVDEVLSACVSLFFQGLQDTFDRHPAYAPLPKKRPTSFEFHEDRKASTSDILRYLDSKKDLLRILLKHDYSLNIRKKIFKSYTKAFIKATPREYTYLFPKQKVHATTTYTVAGNIHLASDWLYGDFRGISIDEMTEIIDYNMYYSLLALYETGNVKDMN